MSERETNAFILGKNVKKANPIKQGMQMFKLAELLEFNCSICKKPKKSKNVALTWAGNPICNGCYGQKLAGKI